MGYWTYNWSKGAHLSAGFHTKNGDHLILAIKNVLLMVQKSCTSRHV